MSKGKYYSLEEAREAKDLEGFAKDHPSEGDKKQFEDALERMAKPLHRRIEQYTVLSGKHRLESNSSPNRITLALFAKGILQGVTIESRTGTDSLVRPNT